MGDRTPLVLVTTTQRCGSTWLCRMLARMLGAPKAVCIDASEMGFSLFHKSCDTSVKLMRDRLGEDEARLFKTHDIAPIDFASLCDALPNLKIVTLSRDFRDVVVSRYFYYRYYWPAQPALGILPTNVSAFLASVAESDDRDSLKALISAPILKGWAAEWCAFEVNFEHENALRLQYEGLLQGTAFQTLSQFCELPLGEVSTFVSEQERETLVTGRTGSARFNRSGRAGQWRDWFGDEETLRLDSILHEEQSRLCSKFETRAD